MTIDLFQESDINAAARDQVAALFRQLNPEKEQLPLDELLHPGNPMTLACCRVGPNIVGIALMGTYRVISGHKGWIEDVVVDAKWRGQGIGRLLVEKLLEVAREKQVSDVLLFTADHRKAAMHLYEKIGFRPKGSNLYVLRML